MSKQEIRQLIRARHAIATNEQWMQEECGSCSMYHPVSFYGDCRDDDNRLPCPPDQFLEDYAEDAKKYDRFMAQKQAQSPE